MGFSRQEQLEWGAIKPSLFVYYIYLLKLFHIAVGSNNWIYTFMQLVPIQKRKACIIFPCHIRERSLRQKKSQMTSILKQNGYEKNRL